MTVNDNKWHAKPAPPFLQFQDNIGIQLSILKKLFFDDDWWLYSPLHIEDCHIFLWSLQEGCPQFQAGLQHHLIADISWYIIYIHLDHSISTGNPCWLAYLCTSLSIKIRPLRIEIPTDQLIVTPGWSDRSCWDTGGRGGAWRRVKVWWLKWIMDTYRSIFKSWKLYMDYTYIFIFILFYIYNIL